MEGGYLTNWLEIQESGEVVFLNVLGVIKSYGFMDTYLPRLVFPLLRFASFALR